jgi:hypothetical protein
MGTFVPIESEPAQSFVNRSGGFLGIARFIGIFDTQNEFAAVMSGKKPVEKRGARAADMEIASRRGGETGADSGIHAAAE